VPYQLHCSPPLPPVEELLELDELLEDELELLDEELELEELEELELLDEELELLLELELELELEELLPEVVPPGSIPQTRLPF
jgi:hypothetical protein